MSASLKIDVNLIKLKKLSRILLPSRFVLFFFCSVNFFLVLASAVGAPALLRQIEISLIEAI